MSSFCLSTTDFIIYILQHYSKNIPFRELVHKVFDIEKQKKLDMAAGLDQYLVNHVQPLLKSLYSMTDHFIT